MPVPPDWPRPLTKCEPPTHRYGRIARRLYRVLEPVAWGTFLIPSGLRLEEHEIAGAERLTHVGMDVRARPSCMSRM